MKKILVTGGAGFIGSHVAEELAKRGNKVTILDNFIGGSENLKEIPKELNINVIKGDICNRKDCKNVLKGVDAVYHIAAHAAEGQSVFIPIFNATTNLIGSLNLLVETINEGIMDFVFTSSIASYGKPESLPIKEDHPQKPEDPYGITKASFENYLKVYHELGHINPYIVRFFNVYGPRQRMDDPYRGVVPIFINKCLKGKNLIIFGDGLQQRALTYISDIIEPICNIIKYKNLINSPINIGSTKPYTMKFLAEKIIQKMGANVEIEYVPERKTDVKITYCDIIKAKKLMNYATKVELDEGLDKTIEWAKKKGPQNFKYMNLSEINKLMHGIYTNKKI